MLLGSDVASDGRADVFKVRERTRRRRIWRLVLILGLIDFYLWYRYLTDNPFRLPTLGPEAVIFLPIFLLFGAVALMMLMPLFSGRSPHQVVRPEEIEIGLDQVPGLDDQVDEVGRTLDVFLGYATFRDQLGGNPRRGSCSKDRRAPGRRSSPRRWPSRPACRSSSPPRRRSSRCGSA